MSGSVSFEQLIELYRRIEFVDNSMSGSFLLKKQTDCNFIEQLLDDEQKYGIMLDSGNLVTGETINLTVGLPRTSFGRVFFDIEGMLQAPKQQCTELDNYFIFDCKFSKNDPAVPQDIKNYRMVISFLSLLEEGSAYFDKSTYQYIFLGTEVFKLSPRYSYKTIRELDTASLENLMSCFKEDPHREQKLDILVNSIQVITEDIDALDKFEYVLNNLRKLNEQFLKGYKIFASGFSYDKIMDQLRAAKVEEMGKIHKALSDIQNHILGIPVASIIVATQFKDAPTWQGQGITNSFVLLGCFIFICLVFLVLCNQKQTLNAISDELAHKKKQINKEFSFIKDDIEGVFETINDRLKIQRWAFRVIGLILIVGLISTVFAYVLVTKPVLNYITAHCSWFASFVELLNQ
ncbi:TPA: hypothetical protein RG680_000993 [Morganella morganii]|uniref:hypothetical protein n=1 Tax=Morganella morganii TaxID=582 RepID=UPI001648F1FB|nr:hypothetical protein [Morganella morganii]HCD1107554.1 hypothetical protein [Morganella morganii]HDU8602237.1 hypothetical protein [Morganella morganii]